jgi:YggT family protein
MDFAGDILGNILNAIATILDTILWLYMWVIIIRALISWVNPDPWNPIVQFLQRATDPVLYQIRKRLGMGSMGFDFSPIIAILLIMFLQIAVVGSLKDLAIRMH